MSHSAVVILDRDGTIVVDRHYLADPAGLEFLPGVPVTLRRLYRRGHRLVVISNQSGVGRGLFSLKRLQQINTRLLEMVRANGADLAGIYCCPHRPEDGCECRKPKSQLLLQASRELCFDPAEVVVVGDKPSDVEFGRRVGATTILICAEPKSRAAAAPTGADHVVPDLSAAGDLIETLSAAASPCASRID